MAKGPTHRRNYGGGGHGYQLDGVKLSGRGVTTLIKAGTPSGGLIGWAAKQTALAAVDDMKAWTALRDRDARIDYLTGARFRDLNAAAVRGTEVHSWAERYVRAEPGAKLDIPEHLQAHVEQYLDFRDTWHPHDEIVERAVFSRQWLYGGSFDLLCKLDGWNEDGSAATVLVDLKTSRSGVFSEVAMQLAAYRYAEFYIDIDGKGDEHPMPEIDACAVLWLRADDWELHEVAADREAFTCFLHCMKVAEAFGTTKDDPGLLKPKLLGERYPTTPPTTDDSEA